MRSIALVLMSASAIVATQAASRTPPGHGDPLPPGHPPVTTAPAGHLPMANPANAANRGDVADVDAIVRAYYASMSGPADAPRDWDRFLSLFLPGARLVTVNPGAQAAAAPLAITPEQFVGMNRNYFTGAGYVERSIHEQAAEFGHVAQVWSTYEARRGGPDATPYLRGINSFQLVSDGVRWWISGVVWDRERPDVPVPPEYLPSPAGPTSRPATSGSATRTDPNRPGASPGR